MALDRDWAALAEGGKAVLGVGWGVLRVVGTRFFG